MADSEILPRLQAGLRDRYEFVRELGRGGMAIVYLANDLKHDREVAVKVLLPELAASIGGDRFDREIRLAAKLSHPHILALYDSGSADGLVYYVMPFVKGESLRARLDREGQLPIEDAIQIALEVAGALAHAHEQGIVHRDIKPENVLISGGHALVADFGIARAASEGGGQKLTQTGMALGTPVYMAPEQAAGEKVGPTADLYSLGCMLYEMLAGEAPFTGKNAMAIMARHAMENVPSIRIVRSSVPAEVEDAIFAAMAKSPADRPQNAAEFAQYLGLPIGATASRRAALRHTASRRIPTPTPTAALTISDAEGSAARAPLWRRPAFLGAVLAVLALAGVGIWQLGGRGAPRAAAATGLDGHNVAVLYFEDLSDGKDLGYLADGLTEGLIAALGQVTGLSVVSRGGVARYRDGSVALDSVARALNAGTLIRGAVERSGDKVRVNVQLVEGGSGATFERASLEEPAAAVLAMRDSLPGKVAELIRKRLGEEIRVQTQRQSTTSVTAWSLVQRAEQLRKAAERAAAADDSVARDRDFLAADSLLAAAEAADPAWPEPITLRALVAYKRSRVAALDREGVERWIAAGLAHANRSLALEPRDATALEIKGNLQYWKYLLGLEPDAARGQALLLQAKADLEAATRINPKQAGAFASLSHLYYRTNTAFDVNFAARRALEADAFLDNADAILDRLFLSSYDLEQFTDAAYYCDETRRRFPASVNAPNCALSLLTTKIREPDVARAWRLADSVETLGPAPRRELLRLQSAMQVAVVLARAGLADSARRVIERSKGDPEVDPTRDVALFGAFAYAQLGDQAKALELLTIYFSANPAARAGYAANPGWQFKSLADTPGFRTLVGTS